MPEKYTPVPTAAPEEARRTAAIPEIHEDVPHVALTTAIARAGEIGGEAVRQYGATMSTVADSVRSLGKAVSGAGDEMFTRALALKQLESEKTVNDATVGYMQSQFDRDEKFKQKEGTAADSTALKAHMEESNNARLAIKNTMTPNEQRMFDAQTTGQYIRSMREAGHHAAQQTKAATQGSYEAVIHTTAASMAQAVEDSDFKTGAERIRDIVYTKLKPLHGWTDEQADMAFRGYMQEAVASRAKDFALRDPKRAMQMLQENKSSFTDLRLWDNAYQFVYRKWEDQGARNIADEADQKMPDAPMADRDAFAAERAERDAPGNASYKDAAVKATYASQQKRLMEEDRQTKIDYKTLDDAANGGGGVRPTDFNEYLLQPGIQDALKRHPERERYLREVILHNIDMNHPIDPNHEEIFRNWQGKLQFDQKEETIAALTSDPALINRLPLTHEERTQLWNLYRSEREKEGKSDRAVRVDYGYKLLGEHRVITDQLYRKNPKDPEVTTFKSVLSELAERRMQDTGKKHLTDKDWVELGGIARRTVATTSGYPRQAEYYQTFRNSKQFKDHAADLRSRRPEMSDGEIWNDFVRSKIEQDLQKALEKPEARPAPPATKVAPARITKPVTGPNL